jgi:hypothetical protein
VVGVRGVSGVEVVIIFSRVLVCYFTKIASLISKAFLGGVKFLEVKLCRK